MTWKGAKPIIGDGCGRRIVFVGWSTRQAARRGHCLTKKVRFRPLCVVVSQSYQSVYLSGLLSVCSARARIFVLQLDHGSRRTAHGPRLSSCRKTDFSPFSSFRRPIYSLLFSLKRRGLFMGPTPKNRDQHMQNTMLMILQSLGTG